MQGFTQPLALVQERDLLIPRDLPKNTRLTDENAAAIALLHSREVLLNWIADFNGNRELRAGRPGCDKTLIGIARSLPFIPIFMGTILSGDERRIPYKIWS